MKNKISASLFSTAGGGYRFEWLVATYYLVQLIRGESARGLVPPYVVEEIKLQQGTHGYPVDDVVVVSCKKGQRAILCLQVKHGLRFTNNPLFNKVIGECWEHFSSSMFNEKVDSIGIVIDEGSNLKKIRTHFQDVLNWARSHNSSSSFYCQVGKFKAKKQVVEIFSQSLDIANKRHIGKDRVWDFIRHLHILSYDFDNSGSRDSTDCWNSINQIILPQKQELASSLLTGLFELVSRYAKSGGEIDYDTLADELGEIMSQTNISGVKSIKIILSRQVINQINKEKNSKKYIPDVFTPIPAHKDKARYFSHPMLFCRKFIDDCNAIDTTFMDRLYGQVGLSDKVCIIPHDLDAPERLPELISWHNKLQRHLDDIIKQYDHYGEPTQQNIEKTVSDKKRYVYRALKHSLSNPCGVLCSTLKDIEGGLFPLAAQVLLITSRAGQGKTNFVCDFADNFLRVHKIPCLLLTGRELRSIVANQLSEYLAKLLYGGSCNGGLNDALSMISSLCLSINKPFVVIFDGINEHNDICGFSVQLEKVIEELVACPFIKIIVTCRTEYFEERFKNLLESSFADLVYQIEDLQQGMSEMHRKRMVRAYFKFFNLGYKRDLSNALQVLENNPLLLRFFCEAYGDTSASDEISLPPMQDVYKEDVFRVYLSKKLEEIASRQSVKIGVGAPVNRPYLDLIRKIICLMMEKMEFSDLPLDEFDAGQLNLLSELIGEDVLFRKDLISGKGILSSGVEVVNFTFDEFRDYLISNYIVHDKYPNMKKKSFSEMIDSITAEGCAVAEGVSRFLFYESKKTGQDALHKLISKKEWYNDTFAECIFSVDEKYVTEKDIAQIKDLFYQSAENAQDILFALLNRRDKTISSVLNINILFEIFKKISEDEFENLVTPIFNTSHYDHYSKAAYPIEKCVNDIEKILVDCDSADSENQLKLIEFLLHLLSIEGKDYDYPALGLMKKIAQNHPQSVINLISENIDVVRESIKNMMWEILSHINLSGMQVPPCLSNAALKEIRNEMAHNINALGVFLLGCRKFCSLSVSYDIVLSIPQYIRNRFGDQK